MPEQELAQQANNVQMPPPPQMPAAQSTQPELQPTQTESSPSSQPSAPVASTGPVNMPTQSTNKSPMKMIAIFLVLILILGGGYMYLMKKAAPAPVVPQNTQQAQQVQPTSAPVNPNSDEQLTTDTQSVDTVLQQLDDESANVDKGLNDVQTNLQ